MLRFLDTSEPPRMKNNLTQGSEMQPPAEETSGGALQENSEPAPVQDPATSPMRVDVAGQDSKFSYVFIPRHMLTILFRTSRC